MEIGNDDLDFIEENFGSDEMDYTNTQDNSESEDNNLVISDDTPGDSSLEDITEGLVEDVDFITSLLKSRGIEDKSKIKFENESGDIEEVDWESLSNDDKLNILNSSELDPERELDDLEIQLINAIRQSALNPAEYLQAVQRSGVEAYLNQSKNNLYKVDDLSDDDLFLADLISRTQNDISEEEALEALDRAKQSDTLYKKLINALRKEYKAIEDESLQQEQLMRLQAAQELFNAFAESIEESITNFTELAGGKVDMTHEDMQELYDFITGFDAAGNSYFGKALNDPNILVRMAWFALNGEQAIRDIEDYYNKEITRAREEGIKKGMLKAKDTPKVVHKNIQKPSSSKSDIYYDLD